MKTKNILFLILFSLFCSFSVFCAVPKWLISLEEIYPSKDFIRMIGEGTSIKQAENDAVSTIAQNFNAKVKVVNQAVKDFNSIVTEEKTKTSKNYTFHQENQISSEVELLCLKYSEPYFDKKHKKYFLVGYINRNEASKYYEQKIERLILNIKNIKVLAQNEEEVLYSILNLQKISKLAELASYYIDISCIIRPEDVEKYKEANELIAQIQGLIQKQKSRGRFSVTCLNKNYSAISNGIASILEQNGFVISKQNPVYRIVVDIHFAEEVYEAGNFVRPDISITIVNLEGNVIESYSKFYPRYSHQNMKNAYSLALVRILQDLEENFLADYRN